MVSRSIRLTLSVATLTSLGVVAGANAGGAAPAPSRSSFAAPQSMVIAAGSDDAYESPNFPTIGKYPTNANIFETLTGMTAHYKIVPDLAVRWRLIRPNTWRFVLRRGVKFQNGAPFNADAVRYTMKQLQASGTTDYIGLDKKAVIRVRGPYVIDITPSFPNRRLPEQLVHPSNSIFAPGSTPTKPVGTGPFQFVSYQRNRQIVVQRFDGYWGPKAKLQQLTFKFVPDGTTRTLALESGDVKAAFDIPRESTDEVQQRRNLRVVRSPVGAYEALYFDIRGGKGFDLGKDPAVRRATALAIDRRVIVKDVWRGNAAVIQTMIPPAVLGPSAKLVKGFSFNPARAKQILDAAGWAPGSDGIRQKNGRRLSLTLVVGFPNADIHGTMPEAVQAMLKDVGIDLNVVTAPDENAYFDMVSKGKGDLFAEVGNQNDANPCFLPDLLFHFRGAKHGDYGYRFGPGGQFDRVIENGCRKAPTTAQAQRDAAEAMHILIDQKSIVIPIAGVFRIYGLSDQVKGFVPHPAQTYQKWSGVSLAANS